MGRGIVLSIALGLIGGSPFPRTETPIPTGYPVEYAEIIEAGNREGSLSIYSTADASQVPELLAQFRALYPKIKVEYSDLNSTELHRRFIGEAAAGATADLVWSSAMDLQMKLINDGYAMTYASPEKDHLIDWAKWKSQAYGTTAEPIVFAYNARLLPDTAVPRTHAEFARLVGQPQGTFRGKVASYDPERSSVGFLYATQDLQTSIPATWEVVRAMGQADAQFYSSTAAMIEHVVSGEHTLAYNAIGSYVLQRQRNDPSLGFVLPSDYTLVMSRIAFVSAKAKNPNAAKLFLDFLLSRTGQIELAKRGMASVRADLEATHGIISFPGARDVALRPIRVGPELLASLDQLKRLRFLQLWQRALHPN
ncbi:ABC transporter substrate-binding protein [Bradyrhizobium erythrophlei]|uniref:ABC transporter substrate-binding protein n=1 Tax=Bradyrhizobium erythrophlei TaxID=1437360 RepID=UPI0035E9E01E